MPRSYQLMTSLRAQGFAAMISGAGPAVLVLGRADQLAALAGFRAPGFQLQPSAVGRPASVVRTDLD
jgi:homoserine kinase